MEQVHTSFNSIHVRYRRMKPENLSSFGQPLKTVEGLGAQLSTAADVPVLDVWRTSDALCRSELRWAVEQLIAKLRGLLPLDCMQLSFGDDVEPDEALTLFIDQHHATDGQVVLGERGALPSEHAHYLSAVKQYTSWVDEDPAERTSIAIATDVERWAQAHAIETEVLGDEAIMSEGLDLLRAVGSASSASPPRLVMAHWRGTSDEPPLMLLGKGITFDSGGINVKPYESFVSTMRNDMAGAALAWSLFKSLVERRFRRALVLVIPTCENPVGEDAMRPGSVVKSYSGKTVCIDHTDAEGRLVLADGLTYAKEKYDPVAVMSFATLTTAALNSYGPYATPVHFATPTQQTKLVKAAAAVGEDLHFFPFRTWHAQANRDKYADLRNTARLPGNASRAAGSRNAAHFLHHFCTDRQLTHFDIFGSTWNWAGDAPGGKPGATGAPLRTLIRAFEEGLWT